MKRVALVHEEIIKVLKDRGATYASPLSSETLGEMLNLSPSYVREQVRLLLDMNLVGVRRGRGGGYFLRKSPLQMSFASQIRMAEAAKAVM